jgi:hypothetical protein
MLIGSIDPGFRNLATVQVLWSTKVRRCMYAQTIRTVSEMRDILAWQTINSAVAEFVHRSIGTCDRIACEEMSGVRHGKDDRSQSGANSDPLLQIQGAVRLACCIYAQELRLIRSQSVNAVLGIKLLRVPGESVYFKTKRQKAATRVVVTRMLAGCEALDEHQIDACAIAIACSLGKGEVA